MAAWPFEATAFTQAPSSVCPPSPSNAHLLSGEWVQRLRPKRWLNAEAHPDAVAQMHEAFNPFAFGPHTCVQWNLTMLKVFVIVMTMFCWYEFVLQDPDVEVHLHVVPACVYVPSLCHS